MNHPEYISYEEKCLEVYGLTPAEFAGHESDMAEIHAAEIQ